MTAANRYAKALFALAAEGRQQPAVAQASVSLALALEDVTVASAIANPLLSPANRLKLAAAMAKSVNAPQSLAGTLGVLATNNRLGLLAWVLSDYQELNDTASGITHVQVASATPLTEAQRTRLSTAIKAHARSSGVRLEETVDTTLMGGFRAFFNGKVWDASLSGNLARLSTRLLASVTEHQK